MNSLRRIAAALCRLLPIRRNQVLFIGYYGAQYGCNPKYISQYLAAHTDPSRVKIIWALTPKAHTIPAGLNSVRFGSPDYYIALATSRVIVTNYRMTSDFVKRRGQVYIQTWHSSLRLKKIEQDAADSLPQGYAAMARRDSAQTDYVIAGSQMSHDTFANAFWYSGPILDFGTPRNDLLIAPPAGLRDEVCHRLGIDPEKKIVMYAPTFRKGESTEPYKVDFKELTEALKERFGGDWTVVLRLHPHLSNCREFQGLENVVDATTYDDVQELLLAADALVSDYSSLMFDFAVTGRPVFLYASDLDDYVARERALYFRPDELPFPLARNNEHLQSVIRVFNDADYRRRVDSFLRSVGSFETGNASQQVSDLITDIIRKK